LTASNNELNILKNSIVTETFVDTADQNYLIARWAYHRGMFTDFFWNSAQSLEKYFKASLLLNGLSGTTDSDKKTYNHNLVRLLDAVSSYAGDLIPNDLEQPKQLSGIHWRKETFGGYIARLNDLGNPDNRYNIYGYSQRWEDLSHLDQAVSSIRRLAFDLDAYPFIGHPDSSSSHLKTVREMLVHCSKYCPRGSGNGSRLHKLLGAKGNDELRDAGLKMNFSFAPDGYDHGLETVKIGTSSSNSVLWRHIVARAENMSASSEDTKAADLADWVVNNVHLSKHSKHELKKCEEILRGRSAPAVKG
jgi:hypothetical protein